MSGDRIGNRKPNIEAGEVFVDQSRGGRFRIKYADEEIVVLSKVDSEEHRFDRRDDFESVAIPSENGVQDPRYRVKPETIGSESEDDESQSDGSQSKSVEEEGDVAEEEQKALL